MKKTICFCLLAWAFLPSSTRPQSGPDATRSGAKNEILSSMVAALPSPPPTSGAPYFPTPAQKFVCNTGYSQTKCDEQVVILRKALANYPVAQLGNWTWILVRSEDWKAIHRARGLDPDSPAFTFYPKRETFIEEALVTRSTGAGPRIALEVEQDTEGPSRSRDPPRAGSRALQRTRRTERRTCSEASGAEKTGLL